MRFAGSNSGKGHGLMGEESFKAWSGGRMRHSKKRERESFWKEDGLGEGRERFRKY